MTARRRTQAAGALPRRWWDRSVVYQVYPRSFADSDGDGVGDLRGLLEKVDHLAWLGVDIVWLSPVYASPMVDNGYDISDYCAVDPTFGTLEDLDEVIAALHQRGIKLVMDLVVNHTSDQHPWFQESRSSPDSPRRDWYWWRAPRSGTLPGSPGAEPTNWASYFSGPAWTFDEQSGEYYLHLFAPQQPDLNWENPEVRQAVHAMMRWWLDRGVDGFRMDVINLISKATGPHGELADGPPLGRHGDGSAQYVCGPRIHEYLAEMRRAVFDGRPGQYLTIGEMPGVTVDDARLFTDPARAELDMVFQFDHVQPAQGLDKWAPQERSLPALKQILSSWQHGLADVGWNSLYWNNHDQPRAVSRFGDDSPTYRTDSAKTLATVLHLHRGTPFIYQGEEIGAANPGFVSIDQLRDVESVNYYRHAIERGVQPSDALAAVCRIGRDNARTPMQWSAAPHGGFTTGTPWLPAADEHGDINVAAQFDDPASVLHHYRALIALRREEDAVALGDYTLLLPDHDAIFAITRRWLDTELLVLANLASTPTHAPVPLDDWVDAELLLPTHPDRLSLHGSVILRPWESFVARRRLPGRGHD